MHLGIGSYTWPFGAKYATEQKEHARFALQILRYASANNIRFVQFCDNLPLHNFKDDEKRHIKLVADESDIIIQTGTRGLTVENIKRYLSIAVFFESPFLRVVIDDEGYHPTQQKVTAIIQELLPELEKKEIVLALENHDRFPSGVLRSIIRNTSEELVGICLDTANSLGAGEGINEILDKLSPYTVNLHAKDINIKRIPGNMGFSVEGTAAGEGQLDLLNIINRLSTTGRCQTATLELWMTEADTVGSTLQKEQEWVDTSIQYLKKILS